MDPYLLLAAAEACEPTPCLPLLDPDLPPSTWLTDPSARAQLPPRIRARLEDVDRLSRTAASWLRAAERLRLAVLTPADPRWPARLRHPPGRPLVLFVRGEPGALVDAAVHVAVIGSRSPTDYGERAARRYTEALAFGGARVWSGLALGIDACAHEAALAAERPTVAVLAGGLDRIDPASHESLAEAIVDGRGALVSEMPPGRRPHRGHYPRRNRILAAATDAVLVVEAGLASGTLHTASHAADCGTPVHAVPGPWNSPRSRGCHRLIAEGAALAGDPEQLLRGLGIERSLGGDADTGRALDLDADATAILRVLERGPRPTDLVQREAGLEAERFLRTVARLTDSGHVARLPGDRLARDG